MTGSPQSPAPSLLHLPEPPRFTCQVGFQAQSLVLSCVGRASLSSFQFHVSLSLHLDALRMALKGKPCPGLWTAGVLF